MKEGQAKYKWKFAIGTTSRVPHSKLHYLIVDFDEEHPRFSLIAGMNPDHMFIQKTPHGWHVYTDLQVTFSKLGQLLEIVGADKSWISIGKSRGYFFLADKGPVPLPWPVERMKLHAKKR
jgi:hypothetical protein